MASELNIEQELERILNENLEPELVEQEVRRYYLDDDGRLCETTQIIKVPTGKLLQKQPDSPKKEG